MKWCKFRCAGGRKSKATRLRGTKRIIIQNYTPHCPINEGHPPDKIYLLASYKIFVGSTIATAPAAAPTTRLQSARSHRHLAEAPRNGTVAPTSKLYIYIYIYASGSGTLAAPALKLQSAHAHIWWRHRAAEPAPRHRHLFLYLK